MMEIKVANQKVVHIWKDIIGIMVFLLEFWRLRSGPFQVEAELEGRKASAIILLTFGSGISNSITNI